MSAVPAATLLREELVGPCCRSGHLQWQHVRVGASGQLAFGLYAAPVGGTRYRPDAIMVLTLDSSAQITSLTAFREPAAFARFGLPDEVAR
jgi:hypothetical protein